MLDPEQRKLSGEAAEATLAAVQKVMKRHPRVTDMNPVLFALAAVQAIIINGLDDEETREAVTRQTAGMLTFAVRRQRVDGLVRDVYGEAAA